MRRTIESSPSITNRNTPGGEAEQAAHGLTELEGAALGIIWRQGGCSAYAVMREFATSRSSSWSASAGAVYPALRRLERRGLISAVRQERKRTLALSSPGLSALREWMVVQPWMGRVTSDPIRTRMFFLEALGEGQRAELLHAAEAETRDALRELLGHVRTLSDGHPDKCAAIGSAFELKARQRWLRWVRTSLPSRGDSRN